VAGNKVELAERNYGLNNTFRALADISKNLSEVPGRKIAIFISEYFPIFLDPARLRSDQPDGTNYSNELREIIWSARRGGLVFYTLDPQVPDSRYSQLLESGMTVPVDITMKTPGLYNIRVGVLETQTGEIGTASNWINVK
jgi:hypothetical protein